MGSGSVLRAPTRAVTGLPEYAVSKLANVLHTFALARRMAGTGVRVNCLHPGVVSTHLLPAWLRLVKPIISPEIIDAVAGARTTMYLALSDAGAELHGTYLDEHPAVVPASALAQDEALQEALWAASMRWGIISERSNCVRSLACSLRF